MEVRGWRETLKQPGWHKIRVDTGVRMMDGIWMVEVGGGDVGQAVNLEPALLVSGLQGGEEGKGANGCKLLLGQYH